MTLANPKKGECLLADASGDPLLADAQDTIVEITDGSLGTASDAIAEITASYVEATMANSLATLAAKVNAILVVLAAHGLIKDA